MMNVHSAMNITLVYATILALMVIALARPSRLAIPIRSIIRFISSAPCGIIITAHRFTMSLIKTFFTTIGVIVSLNLIRLLGKRFTANVTNKSNLRGVGDNVIGRLPCSTAHSTTEIVCFFSTRRDAPLISAPIAMNDHFWISTFFAAIVHLFPFGVPIWALKFFLACVAFYNHTPIVSQYVTVVGVGSEAIGVMQI